MNLIKINSLCFQFFFLIIIFSLPLSAQNYLRVDGKNIIDNKGKPILLKGMGLGGFMLKEGYMMKVPFAGQQYVFEENIEALIGKSKAETFYKSWLQNHLTKTDVDSLKSWGFNSIRLPIHYKLFTLPVEKEPKPGIDTWINTGFELTDSLLKWCEVNHMYLILDMHSTPGGQGHDLPISDRNLKYASLWESQENQQKLINLWKKLAERYKNETYIGGYDLINEPNWGFQDTTEKTGMKETLNKPLRKLLIDITQAIRSVDKNHLIIVEGNGWGNNYKGIFPTWDSNMAVSFHKYWTVNSQESIKPFLEIRDKYNIPLWLGEAGENSNAWFNEVIELAQYNQIGWCWWPLKKIGFNNPLEIKMPEGYKNILNYWAGKGLKPNEDEAYQGLMDLAQNANIKNCIYHKDVIDAMFRQVENKSTVAFSNHKLPGIINAVDYDLGKPNEAYSDKVISNLHITNASSRVTWNDGKVFRNDGVDITNESKVDEAAFFVTNFEKDEWLAYSFYYPKSDLIHLQLQLRKNDSTNNTTIEIEIENLFKQQIEVGLTNDWKFSSSLPMYVKQGLNKLKIKVISGNIQFKSIKIY
jgi:hypothetical protein